MPIFRSNKLYDKMVENANNYERNFEEFFKAIGNSSREGVNILVFRLDFNEYYSSSDMREDE